MMQYSTTPKESDTISALWKLEKIILNTLNFKEVVQKIVDSVLEELGYLNLGYCIIVLALIDEEKNVLHRVSISRTQQAQIALESSTIPFDQIDIPLDATENICVKVIKEKRPFITHTLSDVLCPPLKPEDVLPVQQKIGIKTTMVYPVSVGEKPLGVIIFSLLKDEADISESEKSLIAGFTDVVGLGVQNSRLYTFLDDKSKELSELTTQMYKKNLQLTEKNNTMSVLRKIDEIILTSVTDILQIAQAVTKLLVLEAEFKIAGIYILNSVNQLRRLSVFVTESSFLVSQSELKTINATPSQLPSKSNLLLQAVMDREIKQTNNLADVLMYDSLVTQEGANRIQESSTVKTTIIYPLVVRGEAIGALFLSVSETAQELSDLQKDLLARLHSIIGIAMDNALLYKQVRDSNEKLKALDKMKDEFVSLASHELRTPMTAIKSYIWMALDGRGGELGDKLKYYLTRAYMSTNRLINLVNDMLNISRIESGRLSVQMQSVDMETLINEVIEEVNPRATELGLTVSSTVITSLSPALADADKIKEVLINLIGNSLKFTPKGGKITVSLSQVGDTIETKVTDTGNGISPEDLPKLFQKFAMIEGSYTANQPIQGTGLGLYICKALVELQHGTISASSEGHGKGATFTFTLRVFHPDDVAKYSIAGNGEKVGLVHSEL